MRRRGVISFPSEEKEVIKLMLEKAVAASTMYCDKYEECTNLSAPQYHLRVTSVPAKCYSSTSYVLLQYHLCDTAVPVRWYWKRY